MKKLVLFAVAAVALSFASCSNKSNTDAANNVDSVAVAPAVEEVVETVAPAVDSAAVEVVEAVEEVAAPAN